VHPEKFKQVMGLPAAERHGCAQACASGEWEHFQPRAIALGDFLTGWPRQHRGASRFTEAFTA
jgi:hypothetical protein